MTGSDDPKVWEPPAAQIGPAPGGPGRAVGRFFGLILSFFVLLIGVIWVAADSGKQGWHDKLARTVVVRPSRVSGPAVPAGP